MGFRTWKELCQRTSTPAKSETSIIFIFCYGWVGIVVCWLWELPSIYLDQRKMMCVLDKPLPRVGRLQCDHSVWSVEFAAAATLSPLRSFRWLRWLRPGDLNHINSSAEKVLAHSPNLLAHCSHPVFLYFSHTLLHLRLPGMYKSSSCFSLKRRLYSISQKPSQLLQDHIIKPFLLSCGPLHCHSALALSVLSSMCWIYSILSLWAPWGQGLDLLFVCCLVPMACLHKSQYLDVIVIANICLFC